MNGSAYADKSLPLRLADFETLTDALDYAALGSSGLSFNKASGEVAEQLSYSRLRSRAMAFAGTLAAAFKRGAHIGLVAETSADFVTAFMACQYAGLVPAPVSLPPTIGGHQGYKAQLQRMWEAASLSAILVPERLRAIYDDVVQTPSAVLPIEAGAWANEPAAPLRPWKQGELCYIQFSSGSTSHPKGIVATQSSVVANCQAITRHGLQVRDGDRAVSWLPLYHDMGLVGFFIAPLMSQLSVDYIPSSEFARRPISWLRLISRNRATLSYSPSFGYELCARRYRGEPLDLSSWRAAGIGGDMVRDSVLSQFAETFTDTGFDPSAFVASYGLAEATLAVSFAPLGDGCQTDRVDAVALRFDDDVRKASPQREPEKVRNFVLCGTPVPGHEVRIRSGLSNNLPERSIGRIEVRGPSVAAGHYNEQAGIISLTDEDGWLDTGDLGYWLNGQLVVTGRWKDLIIWHGRNIWPQDVEWAVQETAGKQVGRCVVIDASEHSIGDRIVLIAECRERGETAREALRRELARAARVATGAPVEVVLVSPRSLPVTSSGKLSRSAARTLFLNEDFPSQQVPA
ncbi:fatty acyl-AMP ligase [Henriciella aquimarina]|uniref:fatty acyl-AMP ligase n=1 Tax=Henriciella aquimarina TaxID=545261 RepID=UPI00117B3C50|nr:fatty acyl-AMP ligase [Henriciella aquimarina]